MKRTILKLIVPVLVIAMLLQVPFAVNAFASTLSDSTTMEFVVQAADNISGNVKVTWYATGDPDELVTTMGATLVIDASKYEILSKTGEVITSTYKNDNVQLGKFFPLTANAFDEGEGLEEMPSCSLASYNADTDEMYLFICGLNATGLYLSDTKSEIASFYLQAKSGVKPSEENMRLMLVSEFKNADACPSQAIAPAEISSKNIVFNPTADDIVSDVTLTFDLPQNGTVIGSVTSENNNNAAVTVALMDGENIVDSQEISGEGAAYTFNDVEPGTYKIIVSAAGSLGFTINNVVVTAENTTDAGEVSLLYGDAAVDKLINLSDINAMIACMVDSEFNTEADADGSGYINLSDINIVVENYNITAATQEKDL